MKKIIVVVFLTIFINSYSQKYDDLIEKADSCYQIKEYKLSTNLFKKAFKINSINPDDLYNGACSAALANDKKNAFIWLNWSIDNGWTNSNHLKTDSDLTNLYSNKGWDKITEKVQKKSDLLEASYDKPLQKELIEIYNEDQIIRHLYFDAQKKYGYQGKEVDSLGKIMMLKDSLNLIKVVKILDEKGWVGSNKVGGQANATLFLVIQHAYIKTQQKYLPMMKEAVKNGAADSSSLALLEDRVALREGRKQIYGSQVGTNPTTKKQYVLPLEDPDNVDKRRAEVGLGTLTEYVQNWNITWDVEQYKKDLPEIEEWSKK